MTCDPFLGDALMLKNFGTSMELKDPKEGYFFGISFEGQEIFKNAVKTMARLAEEALEEAGLSVDDIDLCIPHQANLRILEATAKRCSFPMEKMVIIWINTEILKVNTHRSTEALDEKVKPNLKYSFLRWWTHCARSLIGEGVHMP